MLSTKLVKEGTYETLHDVLVPLAQILLCKRKRKRTQELVLKLLEKQGIQKLRALLQGDSNINTADPRAVKVRKLAAIIIFRLAYLNQSVQDSICATLGSEPVFSEVDNIARICISGFPNKFKSLLQKDPQQLKVIQ